MRKTHLFLAGLVASVWMSQAAFAQVGQGQGQGQGQLPAVREVTVGINDAFVPGGFDSEADSYVVVSGIFPNGCYQWKGGEVKHVSSTYHEIRSKAMVSQGMCIMMLIPFTKEVRLGKLEAGSHTLKFVNGDGTYLEKKLSVE